MISERIEYLKEQILLGEDDLKNKPVIKFIKNELQWLEQLKEYLLKRYYNASFKIPQEQAGNDNWYEIDLIELLGESKESNDD